MVTCAARGGRVDVYPASAFREACHCEDECTPEPGGDSEAGNELIGGTGAPFYPVGMDYAFRKNCEINHRKVKRSFKTNEND